MSRARAIRSITSVFYIIWLSISIAPARAGELAPPPDPEFQAISSEVREGNHAEVQARMARWVAAHPDRPEAPRGLLWIAVLDRQDGHGEEGRPLLDRVVHDWPDTEWARHAKKQRADLDLDAWHFSRAIAAYQELAQGPGDYWKYVGNNAAQIGRSQQLRFYGLITALLLLVGLSISRIARAGKQALWPIPRELAWPLPALAVIFICAFGQPADERRAVLVLAVGAMALLWVNGAWLRARPPRGAARAGQALLGVAQACAIFYCAIIAGNLWEKLIDTIQMGAD